MRLDRPPRGEEMLAGSEAYVLGFDFVPYCDASEKNPILTLQICASGHRTFATLSDVTMLRLEPLLRR